MRKRGKIGVEELVQGLFYKIEKRLACKHIFTDYDNTFVSKIISSYNIIAWLPFCGIYMLANNADPERGV